MSKYTSEAALNRDQDIDDTLMEYLGEESANSGGLKQKGSSSQASNKQQQQIELKGSPADMILQLNDYKEKGLISEQQFQQMKSQILGL